MRVNISFALFLTFITKTTYSATTDQFAQLFSDQKIVAAREARANRKSNRASEAAAAIIATAQKEQEEAEAQEQADAQAKKEADAAALFAAQKAHSSTLKYEEQQQSAINTFSNQRSSYKYHIENQFYIKPTSTNWLCLSIPAAKSSGDYGDDQRIVLKKCDTSDTTQLFRYDAASNRIYPEESRTYCVGYDNIISGKPLTSFKCDKVWASQTPIKHQQWLFNNQSHIINSGNKKCLGTGITGSSPHVGNMIKHYDCDDTLKQQNWNWVPFEWYKATEKGRNFIV